MKEEHLMASIFPIPRNTIIVIILSSSKENIQLSQHLTASIQISSPQILFIKICCLENRVEWKSILHDIVTEMNQQIPDFLCLLRCLQWPISPNRITQTLQPEHVILVP